MNRKLKVIISTHPLHILSIFQSLCLETYYFLFPNEINRTLTYSLFNSRVENIIIIDILAIVVLLMIYSLVNLNVKLLRTTTILSGSLYGIIIMYCVRHYIIYSIPTSLILFAVPGLICIVLAAILEE